MIAKPIRNKILAEYDEKKPLFDEYCLELVRLAQKICQQDCKLIHSMNGRVKVRKSLEGKLLRPEKAYLELADITDIVGVRIITHYGRDVDRIAETIRREFAIDQKSSVDKRDMLAPDRFGYLSSHLVTTLKGDRLALSEYARFRGCPAEIQVRSILQHAWAEITHDLDYKSSVEVPREARRAYFRVAGLLELADDEFGRVRDTLADYRASVPGRISREPAAVYIDRDSLVEFARSSPLVKELDRAMAAAADVGKVSGGPEWLEKYVSHFEFLRIQTIEELSRALTQHQQFLKDYSAVRLINQRYRLLLDGVSIAYLPYCLSAKLDGENSVFDYFKRFSLYGDDATRRAVANLVLRLTTDRDNTISNARRGEPH